MSINRRIGEEESAYNLQACKNTSNAERVKKLPSCLIHHKQQILVELDCILCIVWLLTKVSFQHPIYFSYFCPVYEKDYYYENQRFPIKRICIIRITCFTGWKCCSWWKNLPIVQIPFFKGSQIFPYYSH